MMVARVVQESHYGYLRKLFVPVRARELRNNRYNAVVGFRPTVDNLSASSVDDAFRSLQKKKYVVQRFLLFTTASALGYMNYIYRRLKKKRVNLLSVVLPLSLCLPDVW